jgi:predicted nucleic acid-binding Zn ribbon protein
VRPDPLTAPLEAVTGPSWPCSACGTVNPMAQDTCSSCGQHFLHAARQQGPLLDLPVIGDITRLERGQRFALAFGVVLVVIALTLLVGVLFS